MKKYSVFRFCSCSYIALIISMALLFSFGCTNNKIKYELLHDKSEISNVYLVVNDNINEEDFEDVICNLEGSIEIKDIDAFVAELEAVPFVDYMLGSPELEDNIYGVYILYTNGDREYISHILQKCKSNAKVWFKDIVCERVHFDSFIDNCIKLVEQSVYTI